jgi:hypothetical protein
MIEVSIPNLTNIYETYLQVFDAVERQIINLDDFNEISNLVAFKNQLERFDAKLRLGMAVKDIILDEVYVRRKLGELKECHLMLYKLADIWFSYEAFFKFHTLAFGKDLSNRKIFWLNEETNYSFYSDNNIQTALIRANNELKQDFNNATKRVALKEYLNYSSNFSEGKQKKRLEIISSNIHPTNNLLEYSHTEILTITYAIRNNFAHNGEISIYPENFSYILKNHLLKTLYKYLLIITICTAKITTEQRLSMYISPS